MKRLIFLVPIVLCSILTTFAEQIKVPDITLTQGGSATVEIALNNEHHNLVAFQMDLILPEGIGIDKTGCRLSARITDMEQDLVIGKLESGGFRLTSTSMTLTPISGTEGALLILKLYSEENFVNGQAVIGNIYFATSESERIMIDDVSFTINTKYKVTFKYGNEVLTTEMVDYGSKILLPESLNSDRYTLIEWLDVPETMPAHDITIQADYTDGVRSVGNDILIMDHEFYQLNGVKGKKPQRGINIIRTSDGKTQKVLIK